jgi:hypothetical protein
MLLQKVLLLYKMVQQGWFFLAPAPCPSMSHAEFAAASRMVIGASLFAIDQLFPAPAAAAGLVTSQLVSGVYSSLLQ